LADDCNRDSHCDLFAREVSEGAAVVLDSAVWLAFLGGLRRHCLGSATIRFRILRNTLGGEALMKGAFRKISRVGSLTGGTKWYLSDDCLLAAKVSMYVVEYRRFYLRDLESIVVWPSRLWWFRMIIPGVLFGGLGVCLWLWANATAGEIFSSIGVAWVLLELALGPTAGSRVRTTGASIDLPLVKRTRRAETVLAVIEAAVRASRELNVQSGGPLPSAQPPGASIQANSQMPSATASIVDPSETIGL